MNRIKLRTLSQVYQYSYETVKSKAKKVKLTYKIGSVHYIDTKKVPKLDKALYKERGRKK